MFRNEHTMFRIHTVYIPRTPLSMPWHPSCQLNLGGAWARDDRYCMEICQHKLWEGTGLDSDGCLGLADGTWKPEEHPWFRDERSLFQGCKCWSCRTHSRSYVYHLVCAQKILAEVLLFIHNLHHLLELIRQGNSAVKNVRSQIS